jgi:hypothetical protein
MSQPPVAVAFLGNYACAQWKNIHRLATSAICEIPKNHRPAECAGSGESEDPDVPAILAPSDDGQTFSSNAPAIGENGAARRRLHPLAKATAPLANNF